MSAMTTADKIRILDNCFHDVAREQQLKFLMEATEGRGAFPHKPVDFQEAFAIAHGQLEKCSRQAVLEVPVERVSLAKAHHSTFFNRSASQGPEKRQEQEVEDKPMRKPGQE